MIVTNVLRDTDAWRDGLNVATRLSPLTGPHSFAEDFDLQLELRKPGDEVTLWVGRDDRVEEISVTMDELHPIYKIVETGNPTALQLEIRKKWLERGGY